jgi:hypothetical protein
MCLEDTSKFYRGRCNLSACARFASILFMLIVIGCGGGTTGTSPTDSLKFSGVAEQSDGTRAGSLTMTVSSTSSDPVVVDSGTDARGEFSMDLPQSENTFVVDVAGVGSATLERNQNEDGTIAAKLSATQQGTLQISQMFEAQVFNRESCSSVWATGASIAIVGEVGQAPCPVRILTASEELSVNRFEARLIATCAGTSGVVASSSSSSSGVLDIDLNEAFSKGCVDISVVVTNPEAPELKSVFTIE